jgi:hypothetical protein
MDLVRSEIADTWGGVIRRRAHDRLLFPSVLIRGPNDGVQGNAAARPTGALGQQM